MTALARCDCHVNIWNPGDVRPLWHESTARVRPGAMAPRADAAAVLAEARHVETAIVFALRYGDSIGIESDDETTAAAVAQAPDRLVGFAYVDPRRPDCLERLVHAHRTLGLRGVKYGPIYNGVPLSDPRLEPVFAYCEANDLPVTLHMGTTFARNAPLELGRAIHVEPVAMRHPDLTLVLAHMGHPWHEECVAVVRKQPRVFCEISALFYRPWQFWTILVCAEEYRMADKIYFGTDFPFAGVAESVAGLRAVNAPVAGTALPRVGDETIERILWSDPLADWWRGGRPVGA